MSDSLESIEYKGYTIKLYTDDDPMNPRTEWDNFGNMVCWHRRYSLGDKHDFRDPEDFQDFLNEHKGNIVLMPLYLYDHSGITISTSAFSCPWDSGQVGWIYATYADIRKEYSTKYVTKKIIEKVRQLLTSEVNVYDQYLTGQVYGFVIEDNSGESVESCWGYYGDSDYCINEARSIVDSLEKRNLPLLEHWGLLDRAS